MQRETKYYTCAFFEFIQIKLTRSHLCATHIAQKYIIASSNVANIQSIKSATAVSHAKRR